LLIREDRKQSADSQNVAFWASGICRWKAGHRVSDVRCWQILLQKSAATDWGLWPFVKSRGLALLDAVYSTPPLRDAQSLSGWWESHQRCEPPQILGNGSQNEFILGASWTTDRGDRLFRRDVGRRIAAGGNKSTLAGMRIGAIPYQPCSSHSRIAPASNRKHLAHPSIVRNGGRRSFIISIETLLAARILQARPAFGSQLTTTPTVAHPTREAPCGGSKRSSTQDTMRAKVTYTRQGKSTRRKRPKNNFG
jgi:hypothetical protein